MDRERILRSFQGHSSEADVALIEGNRGLYDGVDETGTYSTARLSRLLKIPVILIVDCTKASSTVAACILGCKHFDAEVDLRGIILNNVSPGRHETVIRSSIEQSSGIPVVGAIPRQAKGSFPERHMGLTPFQEHPEVDRAIEASAVVAEKYLDLEALWNIAREVPMLDASVQVVPSAKVQTGRVVIGIIRDTAFQFYYPDNLEALQEQGADLLELNALQDAVLPSCLDALYIGGGFPETQAAALSGNVSFCLSVKEAAEGGLPIYAECGGLIYLGRSLQVQDKAYPMTAVFPVDFILEQRPQAHGYAVLEAASDGPFLCKGETVRGHEFHYSRVLSTETLPPMAYHVQRGGGIDSRGDGLIYKNVLACYTHIHALGTPSWAAALVNQARDHRTRRLAAEKVRSSH